MPAARKRGRPKPNRKRTPVLSEPTAPRPNITAIRFRPPVVIARLGDSPLPMEAFTWAEDTRMFGGAKTIIVPALSIRVFSDGTADTYMPESIRFRDGGAIRPVCPFLELEAKVQGEDDFEPLTGTLLKRAGLFLEQLSFQVTAANLKAQRRTNDPACAFEARLLVPANNTVKHELRAWSHAQTGDLLVPPDRPISLGFFQVVKPSPHDPSLDVIRVRFTPAKGEVYGPPFATTSQTTDSRQPHLIVKEENRILNPAASWMKFDYGASPEQTPQPGPIYDGESDLDRDNTCWGVVDDTCDVIVTARLAAAYVDALTANARVLVGPPDFAPDRRPFYSLVDDLADRDPRSLVKSVEVVDTQEKADAIADLFRRISEYVSLTNVDRSRSAAISQNHDQGFENKPGFPEIGSDMMTAQDKIGQNSRLLSVRAELETATPAGEGTNNGPMLQRAEYSNFRHNELAQPELLLAFLNEPTNCQRLAEILRWPFAAVSELKTAAPPTQSPLGFRDPRVKRSYAYDMRMPPSIRDCDLAPLSLTRFQWDVLDSLLNDLSQRSLCSFK